MKRSPCPARRRWPVACAAAALFASAPAVAVDAVWAGGRGLWTYAGSWSTLAVPNSPQTHVFVDGGKTGVVSRVDLYARVAIGRLTVDAGDTLWMGSDSMLSVAGGTIANAGSLVVDGSSSNDHARVDVLADTVLGGPGQTVLRTGTTGGMGGFSAFSSGRLLTIEAGHTLRGAGFIENLGLANRGTLRADTPGKPLHLSLNTRGLDNAGGTVAIDEGATLNLYGGVLSGGTVRGSSSSSGRGTLASPSSTTVRGASFVDRLAITGTLQLDGATLQGDLSVSGGAALYARGTLDLSGTLTLDGAANQGAAYLRLNERTMLAGAGQTVLATGSGGSEAVIQGWGYTLEIGPGHTVRGAGRIGTASTLLSVVNRGRVRADVPGKPLVVTVTAGPGFDNAGGIVEVVDGATLELSGGRLVGGTVLGSAGGGRGALAGSGSFAGAVLAQGLRLGGSLTLDGVTLLGDAWIPGGVTVSAAGRLQNDGLLSLGGPAGSGAATLRLAADTTLAGTGETLLQRGAGADAGWIHGAGRTLTIAAGQTVRGAGFLGNDDLAVVNQGLVAVDAPGGLLQIAPGSGRSFDNRAGRVTLADAATLNLASGRFVGGTIAAGDAGAVLAGAGSFYEVVLTGRFALGNGVQLDAVTLRGEARLAGGASADALGHWVVDGTLTLDGSGTSGNASLRLAGDTTLAGRGQTVLVWGERGGVGAIYGNRHVLTIAAEHTLRGAGYIGGSLEHFVNRGTLVADVPNRPLNIFLLDGWLDNDGGTLAVADGATLTFAGGRLSGGTVRGSASGRGGFSGNQGWIRDATFAGRLRLGSGLTLESPTVTGDLLLPGGQSLAVLGTWAQRGTLTLDPAAGSGPAELRLAGDTAFEGPGRTVLAGGDAGPAARVLGGGHRLTVGAGHTLGGAGQLGDADVGLVNHGTLRADGEGQTLFIALASGQSLDNRDGVLAAGPGSTLRLSGALALGDASVLRLEAHQDAAAGWIAGRFSFTDALGLDGTLQLSLTGLAAQVGDRFVALASEGPVSGRFDQVVAEGYTLSAVYGAQGVTVTVKAVTPVPEPAAWLLWLGGLAALGARCRRRPA